MKMILEMHAMGIVVEDHGMMVVFAGSSWEWTHGFGK